MEEIVLSLFEEGTLARNGEVKLARPLASLRIPPTIQGILASRIDRLSADEKDLLQTVAVIGTEFNLGVARALSGKADDELNRMLNDLQLAELIYEQPATGDLEYTFKHALTHDVAYNSLLTERRKLLHERTAQTIEALYSERLEGHLTELAHHFDRSGNVPKAVEYLGRTGARAAQQVAHSEAIAYFTRALELLQQLPDGTARDRQELDLQMALTSSSFVSIGEVRLAEREDLAERVLAAAQPGEASATLAGAHYVLGRVQFSKGQFLAAREHLERAIELFGAGPSDYGYYYSQSAPNILVGVLLILGYPSTALGRASKLVGAARTSADPNSIAINLFSDGLNHLVLRDARIVAERADELHPIAIEHKLRMYLIVAAFFRGWATAAAGRAEDGIAEMRRSISEVMVSGGLVSPALMLTTFAESCGKSGRLEEGLDWVAKGLTIAEQTGLRATEAELHRLKGELLLIKGPGNEAEPECCLRRAIEVARRQNARVFELRATVSLARLLRDTNRRREARAMLAAIYNWFTEGFDTADLKEAKALLDELG
jgi:adenylate cyclase